MIRNATICIGLAFAAFVLPAAAQPAENTPGHSGPCILERETLTGDWFGLGRQLEDKGVVFGLTYIQVYQANVRGGLSTHRRSGRFVGRYDAELDLDLETLLGLKGMQFYLLVYGHYSDGIDEASIGSVQGVNDLGAGDEAGYVQEAWFAWQSPNGRVRVQFGRIDLTTAFDSNAAADDEVAQFLASSLVNNPSIPFPDPGMGAVVYVEPVKGWYLQLGFSDAQADYREAGFNTAFHDEDYFFAVAETGLVVELPSPRGPLPGGYRAGVWYDPQPKERFDGGSDKRDDVGFYISVDQMLFREGPDDEQGLTVFASAGWADGDVNEIRLFWNAGLQYVGLIPGRDGDALGIGIAQARLSRDAGFSGRHETIAELYYRCSITPWLHFSPHVQYIAAPGGGGAKDAVVVGGRLELNF